MNSALLNFYEAIEQASRDMLEAARVGNWDHVVSRGACALLICGSWLIRSSQAEARARGSPDQVADRATHPAQRRRVAPPAEPWLEDLDDLLAGRPKTLH